MKLIKFSLLALCFLSSSACHTDVPAREATWTLNKDEWVEHRFGDIVLSSPAQLPVIEIGNGTWYLLLKWKPNYPTEEIVISCHRTAKIESYVRLKSSEQHIQKTGGVILPFSKTNAYLFSASSGFSNKGTMQPILMADSQVSDSDYGVGMALGSNIVCGATISKSHSATAFRDWSYKTIFSREEMQLVEEIAKTIRLAER